MMKKIWTPNSMTIKNDDTVSQEVKEVLENGFATDSFSIRNHSQFILLMCYLRELVANLSRWNIGVKALLAMMMRIEKAYYLTVFASGELFEGWNDFLPNLHIPYKGKFEDDNPLATSCFKHGAKFSAIGLSMSNGGRFEQIIGSCKPGDVLDCEKYQYISTTEPKLGRENIFTVKIGQNPILREALKIAGSLDLRPGTSRAFSFDDYTLVRILKVRPTGAISPNLVNLRKEIAHHLSDFTALRDDVSFYMLHHIVESENQSINSSRSIQHVRTQQYSYEQNKRGPERRTLLFSEPFNKFPVSQNDEERIYWLSGSLNVYWEAYALPQKGVKREINTLYCGGEVVCPALGERFGGGKERFEREPVLLFSEKNSRDFVTRVLSNRISKVMEYHMIDYKNNYGNFYISLSIDSQITQENGEEIDAPYINTCPDFFIRGDSSAIQSELFETIVQFCLGTKKEKFEKLAEYVKENLRAPDPLNFPRPPGMRTLVQSTAYVLVLSKKGCEWRPLENKDVLLTPKEGEEVRLMIAIQDHSGKWVMNILPRYTHNHYSSEKKERTANVTQIAISPLSEQMRAHLLSLDLDITCPIEALHEIIIPPYQYLQNSEGFFKRNEPAQWKFTSPEVRFNQKDGQNRAPHIRNFFIDGTTYCYHKLPDLNIHEQHRVTGSKVTHTEDDIVHSNFAHEYRGGDLANLFIVRICQGEPVLNSASALAHFLFAGISNTKFLAQRDFARDVIKICSSISPMDLADGDEMICKAFPSLLGREGRNLFMVNYLVLHLLVIGGGKQAVEKNDYRGSYWSARTTLGAAPELMENARVNLEYLLKRL
ncbi:MAG TPA: hypothetical protein VMW36_08915, partial [Patescibacteria group bacterium]|nr:hypothetical protein [Patescibacteria group bacterium]